MSRRWWALSLFWVAGICVAESTVVEGMRLWTGPDNTRIVLDLDQAADYKLFTLSGPERVVIDLRNAILKKGITASGERGIIQGLRTGIQNGRDLRVVLDLKGKAKPHSFTLKPDGSNGHRLVVDLKGALTSATQPVATASQSPQAVAGAPASTATPAPTARTDSRAAPLPGARPDPTQTARVSTTSPSEPRASGPSASGTRGAKIGVVNPNVSAAGLSGASTSAAGGADGAIADKDAMPMQAAPRKTTVTAPVKTLNENAPGRELIVAIDAGHGGKDVGARGPSGTHEKDVVLAIARKLAELVDKEPGMRPVLVRDGDYFIRLRDRMTKARKQRADLFVSVHADAFSDHRARGSSVFVVSERGASSEMARILAAQENAADLVGGVKLNDKDELLKSVLLDLSQSASIEASMNVADNVLSELKQVGRVHKTRVQQAGFMVLKSPDVPSILVETAFISNPEEERMLRDSRHQQRLAYAILKGIRAYFRDNPPPGTVIAAADGARREHVVKRGETLSGIAQRYAVSMDRLRVANGMSNDTVRVGGVLRIPEDG